MKNLLTENIQIDMGLLNTLTVITLVCLTVCGILKILANETDKEN